MRLLLPAVFVLSTAPLCVVAASQTTVPLSNPTPFSSLAGGHASAIKHPQPADIQLKPSPTDLVIKNLEHIPIFSIHWNKLDSIPKNPVHHPSSIRHLGPHPSYAPHTIIRAKRAVGTPDSVDGSSLAAHLKTTASLALPHSRSLVPTISSSMRMLGGAKHINHYMDRVFPNRLSSYVTRTRSTSVVSSAAASIHVHPHGFHNHQHPVVPLQSSSPSISPSSNTSRWPATNTKNPTPAAAGTFKEQQHISQDLIIACVFIAMSIMVLLIIGSIKLARNMLRQHHPSSGNNRRDGNNQAGHALQDLPSSRLCPYNAAAAAANISSPGPNTAPIRPPPPACHSHSRPPPPPSKARWQWGGLRSVGQVEEDRVPGKSNLAQHSNNPYLFPNTRDTLPTPPPPPPYPFPSRVESETSTFAEKPSGSGGYSGSRTATTTRVPTTSSGLPLNTLAPPAADARGRPSRSNSRLSNLFNTTDDPVVQEMGALRNESKREKWSS